MPKSVRLSGVIPILVSFFLFISFVVPNLARSESDRSAIQPQRSGVAEDGAEIVVTVTIRTLCVLLIVVTVAPN